MNNTQGIKLSNSIKIEKDEKYYILHLSCDLNFISMKFRIDKPFKLYEKQFSKKELEEICNIFKSFDQIKEAFTYINSILENKQFSYDISEQYFKLKLNKYYNFEFKEFILTKNDNAILEKVENLLIINDDLQKEINNLKLENEELKKKVNSLQLENEKLKKIEIINIQLKQGKNYEEGYNQFKIYRLQNYIIKLSGVLICNYNKSICQLPEGCRPKKNLIFACRSKGSEIRVDILSDGNIIPSGNSYSYGNEWVSFDGISFFAGL